MTPSRARHSLPETPILRGEWRALRRAAIRQHHPDRGGSAEVLQAELARIDRLLGAGRTDQTDQVELTAPGRWQPLGRVVRRGARRLRDGSRSIRTRLPRSWPGSRRYLDL